VPRELREREKIRRNRGRRGRKEQCTPGFQSLLVHRFKESRNMLVKKAAHSRHLCCFGLSLHVRESEKFVLVESRIREIFPCGIRTSGFLALESVIQLKESGIQLTIRVQNPSSTGK